MTKESSLWQKNKINQPPKFGTAHVNAEQRIKNETTCKNRKMEDIIEMNAMKKIPSKNKNFPLAYTITQNGQNS